MKTAYLAQSLLLATVLLAAGCGGGGGGNDPGSPPVAGGGGEPQVEAMGKFTAFVKEMIQIMLDGAEPVDVSAFDPPTTSDTREPFNTAAQ